MIVHDWNKSEPIRDKFDMIPFTKECVSALNEIILKTKCKIVLSSDHRHNYNLNTIKEIFKYNECIDFPFSITPLSKTYTSDNLDKGRADEILMWLDNCALHIESWVAVDDLNLGIHSDYFKNHFIDCQNGISNVKEEVIYNLNNRNV